MHSKTPLDPPIEIDADGHSIRIDGLPTVSAELGYLPPPDFEAETIQDLMSIGHILTAQPALNAISDVVAADPGIVTTAEGGAGMPRGWVPLD
ncbi:MAG: hypothetical protein ACK5O2_08160 [Microthrixaceae bacterium]